MADSAAIDGPFGVADLVLALPVGDVIAAYRRKCDADVTRWLAPAGELRLFECRTTGYRFWRPSALAGDESFYAYLSSLWPDYYRSERWEYPFARKIAPVSGRVLEIGCGRGYFLKSLEGRVGDAVGIEFNTQAIANKVTRFPVINQTVEQMAEAEPGQFDLVCSFQVLEHVVDPNGFIAACVRCLRPGGRLALATPNHASAMLANREDAFDLPPHHMGHFSPMVYRRIAALFGLEVERLLVERRYFVLNDTVTQDTRRAFVYRAGRRVATILLGAIYRWLDEPGNNVLAIMKRAEERAS